MRNSSTAAPGSAVPAITALPACPTSATSNAGMITSPLSGDLGATADGSAVARLRAPSSPTPAVGATAAAAVVGLVSDDGCVSYRMPQTSAAPDAAINASNGRAILATGMGVMRRTVGQLVGSPSTPLNHRALISAVNQVRVPVCRAAHAVGGALDMRLSNSARAWERHAPS